MKNLLGVAVLGACAVLLAQACGSEDGKKNVPTKRYGDAGGEGGESAGGAQATGGKSGSSGAEAGQTSAESGAAGHSSAGAGGAASDCPAGFGECDGDPETVCEQDLNLVTSCGACDNHCDSTNADSVSCEAGKCVVAACSQGFGDCNASGDDGCEASVISDEHCGACDRDCAAAGSTCAVDHCKDIPLQMGQPIGADSGVNRTWAFSPLGLLHVGFNSYVVRRFPLDGGAPLVVWNSTNKTAGWQSLLVDGDNVYWSELGTSGDDFTSGVFYKKITDPAASLKQLAWVPEWHVQLLRRQGKAFYWFSGDYQSGDPGAWIYTRAADADLDDHGTKIMSVDQGTHDGMVGFNVTSNALYWISTHALTGNAYELRTAPLAGGVPAVVPAVPGGTTTAVSRYGGAPSLQVVGDTIYFNRETAETALDGIYSFKKGDAKPKQLVQGGSVHGLLVDADFIYYVQQNVAGIWKAPISGGAGVKISDSNVSRLVGQDATFVYGITSSCCAGNIFKALK